MTVYWLLFSFWAKFCKLRYFYRYIDLFDDCFFCSILFCRRFPCLLCVPFFHPYFRWQQCNSNTWWAVVMELASRIWFAVNLEENHHNFCFLKCLAHEGVISFSYNLFVTHNKLAYTLINYFYFYLNFTKFSSSFFCVLSSSYPPFVSLDHLINFAIIFSRCFFHTLTLDQSKSNRGCLRSFLLVLWLLQPCRLLW